MQRWAPNEEDLTRMIPTEAYYKRYRLTWYNPRPMHGHDPTVLFFRGFEVYRWQYDPTMGEVWDKIQELETLDTGRP